MYLISDHVYFQEKAKERQLREAMESDLYEKDKQLQEIMAKHQEVIMILLHCTSLQLSKLFSYFCKVYG